MDSEDTVPLDNAQELSGEHNACPTRWTLLNCVTDLPPPPYEYSPYPVLPSAQQETTAAPPYPDLNVELPKYCEVVITAQVKLLVSLHINTEVVFSPVSVKLAVDVQSSAEFVLKLWNIFLMLC